MTNKLNWYPTTKGPYFVYDPEGNGLDIAIKGVESCHLYFPKKSEWVCYLFGSKPGSTGCFIWHPSEGDIPNFFVRFMMKVCLGCTWVKEVKSNDKS